MSLGTQAWIVIAGLGVLTYLVRFSFLGLAHRLTALPGRVRTALRMIPPAALAALVAPALVRPEGVIDLTSPRLWAGLLALAVAWWTRSMLATITVGLVAVVVLQQVLG